ncbi:MAG: hemerythrin domain-containing protein [Leptothrix sp. (in: b-proteobacteria)]
MIPSALTIIRNEHQAIAAVLHALRHTVNDIAEHGRKPNFEVLRALLFYIDAYPERLHHPKESEHLFKRLRERSGEISEVLDRLDRDHDKGEQEILRLEHQLLEVEMLGAGRMPAFVAAVELFCDRYREHMHIEEQEVLPLARRVLTEADWAVINAAFDANRDPLTGHKPEQEYEDFLRRIVNLLPAPLGLGPAAD